MAKPVRFALVLLLALGSSGCAARRARIEAEEREEARRRAMFRAAARADAELLRREQEEEMARLARIRAAREARLAEMEKTNPLGACMERAQDEYRRCASGRAQAAGPSDYYGTTEQMSIAANVGGVVSLVAGHRGCGQDFDIAERVCKSKRAEETVPAAPW